MRLLTTLALIACFATSAFAGDSETMRVETSDGFIIKGEFWTPRKKGRAPAALLLHDTLRDKADHEKIATNLNKRGFAVLSIDLRGHGKSVSEKLDSAELDKLFIERLFANFKVPGIYVCVKTSLLIASNACSLKLFPVLSLTMKLTPEVTPDCIIDAVEKPEAAGAISAIGAIKHPDNATPRVAIKNNLLNIESPSISVIVYFLYFKQKE